MIRESKSVVLIYTVLMLAALTRIPFSYASDNTTRKEIEALYAKIDQSRLKKENDFYQSLETDGYTSKTKDGKTRTRKEADAESNAALAGIKEVQYFKTKVEDLKEEENGDVTVLISLNLTLIGSGSDGKEHKFEIQGKARDVWVKTDHGWKIKSHEAIDTSATVDGQTQEGIHKLAEAGIQFTVPANWSVEKDKNGTTIVTRKEGDNYYVITFGLLDRDAASLKPEGLFESVRQGILADARKDFKEMKLGEPEEMTINGIPARRQAMSGQVKDVASIGMIYLLSAERPIIIYVQGTLKKSSLDDEFDLLMSSIKKIE